VDFAFSDEQEQLREVVRKYLAQTSPEAEVRRLMATDAGYDDAVWKDMASQLGLQGIVIPEQYGGSGFGFLELSVILEEMGRALLCAPYFSTVVLATPALLASGDEDACNAFLPSIASGDLVATFAVPAGFADGSALTATASGSSAGDGHVLDGVAEYVIDGSAADVVLVCAATGGGQSSIFAVSSANAFSSGVLTRTALQSLDRTRKLSRLEFNDTPAQLVGGFGGGAAVVDAVLRKATVALASELVGICQWGVATSAEYARDRVQFGRPIGSFQAIKHKCVDMLLDLESAKALAYYAAWAVETDAPDLPVVSSVAKAECSEAAVDVTIETLHVHGGIGFTWEHPAHLYLKRAESSALLFGDPRIHRELVCTHLGY
jgi:alkylation response protein AidB-like acyl-CoA dehydrogenase